MSQEPQPQTVRVLGIGALDHAALAREQGTATPEQLALLDEYEQQYAERYREQLWAEYRADPEAFRAKYTKEQP